MASSMCIAAQGNVKRSVFVSHSSLTAMKTIFALMKFFESIRDKRDVVFDRAVCLSTAGDEQEKQILNRRQKSKRNRSMVFLDSSLILHVVSNKARRRC